MSGQFVGAMCATGVLNMNVWGWPTLGLKIGVFFAGILWLALNYLDNQGYDYPLIRLKYYLLLLLAPLVWMEGFAQWQFFANLNPEVITSCCGSLFSSDGEGVASEITSIPAPSSMLLLYGTGLLVLLNGVMFALTRRGGRLLMLTATLAFVSALVAIVAFVSPYVYEHPHHHCPFCLLKSGHDFVGYWLYILLFFATASSLMAGVMVNWRQRQSLRQVVPPLTRRLSWMGVALFSLFYLLATWLVYRSNLTMEGVWW